jgi:hypothetical protein
VIRVGVLVAALLATTPGVANAFTKAIWGPAYVNGVNQFPIYQRLHVGIVETAINWAEVAPTRPSQATNPNDPAYLWPADIQQEISLAQQYHMRVLIQLVGAPPWANGNHPSQYVPRNPKDFANFAAAASRRYPQVRLWMIWGEPSRQPNFAPMYPAPTDKLTLTKRQQIAPRNYSRILDASYGVLKAVSRKNLVIGGNTYTTGSIDAWQWIKYMKLPNGKPPRMDMYGHNPFSFEAPDFSDPPSPLGASQFSDLRRLAAWMDRYLMPGLPLFLSEFTVPTAPDQEFNFWVDPLAAAKWVREALSLSRGWKRIYALGWVHVYDEPGYSSGGLLTAAGKPKPTFYAFAH